MQQPVVGEGDYSSFAAGVDCARRILRIELYLLFNYVELDVILFDWEIKTCLVHQSMP
jgi:hypothetical protein